MENKITLKDRKNFVEGVTKGLLKLGAVIQPVNKLTFPCTEFKLNTIVGNLDITLYHKQGNLFTIFSRFEDAQKAKVKFDCNPFSGKYNFQSVKSHTTEQMIEFALMHFECTQEN